MITKETNDRPRIEWERCDWQCSIEGCNEYGAIGYSEDGRKFEGTWIEGHGCIDITDIEEIN